MTINPYNSAFTAQPYNPPSDIELVIDDGQETGASQEANIGGLPIELWWKIGRYCDWTTLNKLGSTCHYFKDMVDDPAFKDHWLKEEEATPAGGGLVASPGCYLDQIWPETRALRELRIASESGCRLLNIELTPYKTGASLKGKLSHLASLGSQQKSCTVVLKPSDGHDKVLRRFSDAGAEVPAKTLLTFNMNRRGERHSYHVFRTEKGSPAVVSGSYEVSSKEKFDDSTYKGHTISAEAFEGRTLVSIFKALQNDASTQTYTFDINAKSLLKVSYQKKNAA